MRRGETVTDPKGTHHAGHIKHAAKHARAGRAARKAHAEALAAERAALDAEIARGADGASPSDGRPG
jgi:hypothetical protein